MHESRRAEGHIDEKIYPVDIRAGDEYIAAEGVNDPDSDAEIIGDLLEKFFDEPRSPILGLTATALKPSTTVLMARPRNI